MGETEQRINLVVVWREAPMFSEKERAALALAEAVTLISQHGVSEDLYDDVRKHYDKKEYVALIMTINAINCWNRLTISTGMFPGCFDN
jgi:alkylhydroperoxidase family enzyme